MAYNDLSNNQTISFNNLQSGVAQGVFTAKTTIPSSTKQITKTEANTYVNINTSLPSYAAKASNQLVTKEDLSGITSTSPYLMYGVAGTAAYKSTDGGNTFTALSGLTSSYTWRGIAGDYTGTYIAVIANSLNLTVYLSSDGGATFTVKTISGVIPNFYPTGIAMSNNGQYIGIAGLTNTLTASGLKQAIVAGSSDYGVSFSPYLDSLNVDMYQDPFKISVSGNGQYMTAVYSYQVDPGGINRPRPWSFRIYSSNYGVSWTRSGGSEFSRFFDIALDGTGQNQFLTTDWCRPGIGGSQGIKAFVTNDFGANWTERYSNTVAISSPRRVGFTSATISDNGQVMVGSTDEVTTTPFYDASTFSPLVIASFNSGSTFAQSDGYNNNVAISGGTDITTGITNNYIAMMLNNIGQFNYSINGGSSFLVSATTARAWSQIYRKALLSTGPAITNGLVLSLDASNVFSYPGSGTTWTDISGNGNNMTMNGTVPINGSGLAKYFSYNGTANYFQGVNNFTSSISNAITISIVASITDMSQRTALFSKYLTSGITGYVLEIGTIGGLWTNTMRWYAAGTGGQSNDYRGTSALNQNQIYIFTLTYNQSTGATAFYANATSISATQAGTNAVVADWSQGATPFLTGNYGPGLTIYSYMNEYMVLVYNRALTSTEVSQNYNALKTRFGI